MARIKIVLVDDHKIFVESLKTLLEAKADDFKVIGLAYNGFEAIRCVEKENPDIVLMDVRMPEMNGVEATRHILGKHQEMKIIMLTTFDDDEYVYDALNNGALGYLLKDVPPMELIAAIRAVNEGAAMISPPIVKKLVRKNDPKRKEDDDGNMDLTEMWETLTTREKEIFKLILEGFDNSEIAETLFLSEQTVKNYISHIYEKLGAKNRLQLIRIGKSPFFDSIR
ncbi:MAG TPA: response regulator transcription factor [Spirochaetia bacterium]|nr:response regulator transcription factor [Spirochaetia bacterium]